VSRLNSLPHQPWRTIAGTARFTRVGETETARALDADHGGEIVFAFGRSPAPESRAGTTPYDARLADAMIVCRVAFAGTGDPNGPPAAGKWPRWPSYDAQQDVHLDLGRETIARRGLRTHEYDALDAWRDSRPTDGNERRR
jgi:carboxylesterase type B